MPNLDLPSLDPMIMLPCRKNTAPGVLLLYSRLYINTLFFIEFYFAAHVSSFLKSHCVFCLLNVHQDAHCAAELAPGSECVWIEKCPSRMLLRSKRVDAIIVTLTMTGTRAFIFKPLSCTARWRCIFSVRHSYLWGRLHSFPKQDGNVSLYLDRVHTFSIARHFLCSKIWKDARKKEEEKKNRKDGGRNNCRGNKNRTGHVLQN